MILSYHPMVVADRNLICAGRDPGPGDKTHLSSARAVILPQGCRKSLYDMAVQHCPHVFPDYGCRFKYPGKIGQIELFRATDLKHPLTATFTDVSDFDQRYPDSAQRRVADYPLVFKFDWGGEGETVHVIHDRQELQDVLGLARSYEASGQKGFLIQSYIPHQNRVLRVVVLDRDFETYWRIQDDPRKPLANVRQGGRIDTDEAPDLQKAAVRAAARLCRVTGINLAGLDLIFEVGKETEGPYFLEINYFFGRRGLGGSEAYYRKLNRAVRQWLKRLDSGGTSR